MLIKILERRVEELEHFQTNFLERLDSILVESYGLKKHCRRPTVLNGEARCPEKLPPTSKVSIKSLNPDV